MKPQEAFIDDVLAAIDRIAGLYPELTTWDVQAALRIVTRRWTPLRDADRTLAVLAGHATPQSLRQFEAERETRGNAARRIFGPPIDTDGHGS